MKIHNAIIGAAMVVLLASGFGIFLLDGAYIYSRDYDNSTLHNISDQVSELERIGNDTRVGVRQLTDPDTPFDIIGGFFKTGYSTLQVIGESFNVFFIFTEQGVESIPGLGKFGGVLLSVITLLLISSIIIGVLLYTVMKSDRI